VRTSILLTALVLLFSVSSSTQEVEHAPTAAQCQADERVWSKQFYESPAVPTLKTLRAWQNELHICRTVDAGHRNSYHEFFVEIMAGEDGRAMNFLIRHDLDSKFMEEDAAGQR